MQIPNRVRITREVSYKVVLVKAFADPDIVGLCDEDSRTIYLKKNEPEIFSTFIHEILHAITFETKLKLTHKQIYAIEGPLSKVLRLNRLGWR